MRSALDERRHGLWEHVAVEKKKRTTSQFAPFFTEANLWKTCFLGEEG